MKKGKRKRMLSWLLVLCLCVGAIPTYVLTTKAATEEADVATVSKPTTGIVNPPVVVTRVDASNIDNLGGSAVAIMHIDSSLNILDGETTIGTVADFMTSYGDTIVPAFYLDSDTEVTAICDYLSTNNITDALYVTSSANATLLKTARTTWSYARGIIEYDSLGDKTARAAMRRELNKSMASIAIVPSDELDVEITAEYNARLMSVWADVETAADVYAGIANGYNGMIASTPDTIIDVYESITKPTLSGKPIVIGHQGTTQTIYAQNTLEAFEASMKTEGVMGFECDANYKTSDGTILIMHDATLNKMTNYEGTAKISEMSIDEVRQYTIDVKESNGTQVPTITDLFQKAATMYPDAVIYLETQRDYRAEIEELINTYNMQDNVVIFCRGANTTWGTDGELPVLGGATRATDMINKGYSQTETGAISYMIDVCAPLNQQQIPTFSWMNTDTEDTTDDYQSYGYDCISTKDTLSYRMAARGFLLFQSTVPSKEEMDRYFITGMGSTALLADYTNYTKDYCYSILAEDVTLGWGETLDLKKTVTKNYGTTTATCGIVQVGGDELTEKDGSYTMDTNGKATIVYYADIKQDTLEYRIYSEPVTVEWKGEELPTVGYQFLTPLHYDIADGTYTEATTGSANTTYMTTMDKVMFEADVTYGSGAGISYIKDSTNANKTLSINYSGGAIRIFNSLSSTFYVNDVKSELSYFHIRPSVALGTATFEGQKFRLAITTEYVEYTPAGETADGAVNDIKLGIWFNGKLYDESYLYFIDCATACAPHLTVQGVTISSPTMPDGYKVVTPLQFGIADDTAASGKTLSNTKWPMNSIDKVALTTKVCYGSGSGRSIYYLDSGSANQGILFWVSAGDGTISLYNYETTTATDWYLGGRFVGGEYEGGTQLPTSRRYQIAPSKVNLSSTSSNFINDEFLLTVTTEFIDFDGDGNKKDLQLGIWINGALVAGKYVYLLNFDKYVNQLNIQGIASISSPLMLPNDMGVVSGEYASTSNVDAYTSDLVATKVMNGTTFQSDIRFEGQGGTLYYGCAADDSEKAVKITSTADGLQISHTFGTEEVVLEQLTTTSVGMNALDDIIDLKITTDVVELDTDGADDVKLGIWINDTYQEYEIADVASVLTAKVGVKTDGAATVLFGPFKNDTPKELDVCLNDGAYTKTKTESMTRLSVDGKSEDTAVTLDYPGTYSVVSTEDGYVSMEDVTAYRNNDVNANNTVEITDLVRMLKVADETTHEKTVAGLTKAERKAIKYDADTWSSGLAKSVLNAMRKELIGYQEKYEMYTDFETGYILAGTGAENPLSTTIRSKDFITIDNFVRASVDDSYVIVWYAYRRDHVILGNNYSSKLSSFTKEDILAAAPQADYIRIVVMDRENDETVYPDKLAEYGVDVQVRYIPSERECAVSAIDETLLTQFANEDGAYTMDFAITASCDFMSDIWILSCDAMYVSSNGQQPTIQYELMDEEGNLLYYAHPYVVGDENQSMLREWRVPAAREHYNTVKVSFVIPEGVALYINDFSNRANDAGYSEADNGIKMISHSGFMSYCAENTADGFRTAGEMGYQSLITIPKFTAPTDTDPIGVGVCFHDDEDVHRILMDADGTSITEGEAYYDTPISEITYEELMTLDAGLHKDEIYKGMTVPTLDEYFSICAEYGMDPVFSVHSSNDLTEAQWENVKDLLKKYSILDKFYVKTADTTVLKTTLEIFGDQIGGYTLLQPIAADWDMYSIAKSVGFVDASGEVDFERYNVGVEYFQQASDLETKIGKAVEQGFTRISLYGGLGLSGQEFTRFIELGVKEFSIDYHCSMGLNW